MDPSLSKLKRVYKYTIEYQGVGELVLIICTDYFFRIQIVSINAKKRE